MEGFCLDKGNIETRSLFGGGGGTSQRERGVLLLQGLWYFSKRVISRHNIADSVMSSVLWC